MSILFARPVNQTNSSLGIHAKIAVTTVFPATKTLVNCAKMASTFLLMDHVGRAKSELTLTLYSRNVLSVEKHVRLA